MMHKMNLNPWMTMWTNPRKTIREIVNISPKKGMFILACIFGLQYLLSLAHSMSLGQNYSPLVILIASLVCAPFIGYFWFYVFSGCVYWTGKLFKGQSQFFQILSSVAWSAIPYILNVLMWFIFLATSTFTVFVQQTEGFTFFFINLISLITAIWSLILVLKCIKEVQDFSYWKSIGNYLAGLVVYFLILFGIGTAFAGLSYFVTGVV